MGWLGWKRSCTHDLLFLMRNVRRLEGGGLISYCKITIAGSNSLLKHRLLIQHCCRHRRFPFVVATRETDEYVDPRIVLYEIQFVVSNASFRCDSDRDIGTGKISKSRAYSHSSQSTQRKFKPQISTRDLIPTDGGWRFVRRTRRQDRYSRPKPC
jgi:hypothetical protein